MCRKSLMLGWALIAFSWTAAIGQVIGGGVPSVKGAGNATDTAAAPFGQIINRPGNLSDASVCELPGQVDFQIRPGCRHFDDLSVLIVSRKQDVLQVRWNGMTKYALANRATINCRGTAISITSYIVRSFPPGVKC
jgi:hypothetical protein